MTTSGTDHDSSAVQGATAREPRRRDAFLPFSQPTIGQEEIDEVVDTLRSDWITTGPKTKAFEGQFGAFVGAPDETSLMLSSCTAGLLLSLAAHGVGPGDEVIVPSLTFAATANVAVHLGATPVLVDIEPDTMCIDPERAAAAVTERTKAIMPVHYAGHPADLAAIDALAERHGLHVVEDAAHAVPTHHRDTMIGSRPTLASFSFYPTKNLTTAEGGALTGAPELLEKARMLALHGMSRDAWKRFGKGGSWEYDVVAPGFKTNMTDIQAALGMHQLRKLPDFHARRREIARRYTEAFAGVPALEPPTERDGMRSAWHIYVLRLRLEHLRIDRNAFIDALKERNVGTSVHYKPLHMMSYYAERFGYARDHLPVSADAFSRMLSIPLSPRLSDADVDDVITIVRELVDEHAA
jgi:dTDP-4-amino-4,6-dideoxygalactose transaminase